MPVTVFVLLLVKLRLVHAISFSAPDVQCQQKANWEKVVSYLCVCVCLLLEHLAEPQQAAAQEDIAIIFSSFNMKK